MNPSVMGLLLVTALALFAWSMTHRLALLRALAPRQERCARPFWEQLKAIGEQGLRAPKMLRYPWSGWAHRGVLFGFLILLLRTGVLVGRGFDAEFNGFFLGRAQLLGAPYALLKDLAVVVVLLGVTGFGYLRIIRRESRLTLNREGLLILGSIAAMMIAELLYEGASRALHGEVLTECSSVLPGNSESGPLGWCSVARLLVAPLGVEETAGWESYPAPFASAVGLLLNHASPELLTGLALFGYWTHLSLVFLLLNSLPYSKHFHIITALPNLALSSADPPGRIPPLAAGSEALTQLLDRALSLPQPEEAPLGIARIEHLTWKDGLDLFSCTECGRCSQVCPATLAGKPLDPKRFIVNLRDHLYAARSAILTQSRRPPVTLDSLADPESPIGADAALSSADPTDSAVAPGAPESDEKVPLYLVPQVIEPEAVWACTTCRACEEACPVGIRVVNKIIGLRRHLVTVRGEHVPQEMNQLFATLESSGNPWGYPANQREAWMAGLAVPTLREHPTAPLLFWVGCSAAFDPRGRRVARATARLLQAAGLDFAVLGNEERCTGDAARRAGNEHLYLTLAEHTLSALKRYQEQGGVTRVVTGCPHCFNTLAQEYPDLGGHFSVVHTSVLWAELLQAGKLKPSAPLDEQCVFHDPCYLGRYGDQYAAPREVLDQIPGLVRREVPHASGEQSLCCGAGGAQQWMRETTSGEKRAAGGRSERTNQKRTLQLVETGAQVLVTGCPFCMTQIADGVKSLDRENQSHEMDLTELLAKSCGLGSL